MSAKHLIGRLSDQTDALAARVEPRAKQVVITCPISMDQDAVIARHMKLFPADRNALQIVVIRRFGDADPDAPCGEHDDPKVSRAWRELARELQATRR